MPSFSGTRGVAWPCVRMVAVAAEELLASLGWDASGEGSAEREWPRFFFLEEEVEEEEEGAAPTPALGACEGRAWCFG